jgi:predicted component of type VI protein secretion system
MALQQNKSTLLQQIDRNSRRKKDVEFEFQEDGKRQKETIRDNLDKLLNI